MLGVWPSFHPHTLLPGSNNYCPLLDSSDARTDIGNAGASDGRASDSNIGDARASDARASDNAEPEY